MLQDEIPSGTVAMDLEFSLKLLSFKWRITIRRQWLQYAIVVIAVLAGVVIGFWGTSRIWMLVLALLGGIAALLILIQQPNLGFILILLGGIFVPIVGPSGVNAAVVVVAGMLGLWLADFLTHKPEVQFPNSPVILPVVVFMAISVIAFGMGQIPWFIFANQAPLDAQVGGFAIFVLSAGGLLVSAYRLQDERWLQAVVWTFIGLGSIYILGRAARIGRIDDLYHWGFDSGSMFWTWLVALALGQAVFNKSLAVRYRLLLGLLVAATFYVALAQGYDWKSGWLPPLVAVGAIVLARYKQLTIFAIPAALLFASAVFTKLINSDWYSWGTRMDAWIIVLQISQVNPLLGLGFANYYWYTPLFPIRGWAVSFNSHSQYVDLIAQTGIVGLLCYLWIFFELGRLGWRLSKQLPDGFANAYANGVFAGVVATMVAGYLVDWVLPFVYNIGFAGFRASILPWIFCGGLVAIEQIYAGKTQSELPTRSA
jgi:hypothetical protein